MRYIVTLIAVLMIAARAYGVEVEFVGEPNRWNPVDISTTYTQKIIFNGQQISVIVACGGNRVGTEPGYMVHPSTPLYGEKVFVRVCGRDPDPEPNTQQSLKPKFKETLSAKELSAISKRVLANNKKLSKRIAKGYIPDLPMSIEEEAAYMQLALNTKSISPVKGFLGECYAKQDTSGNKRYVICYMYWPNRFTRNNVSQQYIDYVEMTTSSFAKSFKSSSPKLISLVNIEGVFTPVHEVTSDKVTGASKGNGNKLINQ